MIDRQKEVRKLREMALDLAIRLKDFEESVIGQERPQQCEGCFIEYGTAGCSKCSIWEYYGEKGKFVS